MAAHAVTYYLTEHPTIVNFRWSPTLSYASTWSFLFAAVASYVVASVSLHILLRLLLFRRREGHGLPLGPIPAVHSLITAVISAVIFLGILLSAAAEIRDTRWLWRRRTRTTAIEWFLCFPVGTRPSGRVFFWSYIFYLSRFLHLFRTFFSVIRRRRLSLYQLLNQSFLLCMSFLWLEFSQSIQVVAILLTTMSYCVVYGYKFWTGIGLRGACFPFVIYCQAILLSCLTVCHIVVPCMHLVKRGGCNGIGAWLFNSVLNAAISLLFLKFFVQTRVTAKARSCDHKTS